MTTRPILKITNRPTREFWQIPILYEDDHLLAVEKPAGLLTSPDRYDPDRANLMRMLHQHIEEGAQWVVDHSIDYLANVHRLDFETSGVLLLTKDKPSLVQLTDQFNQHRPVKQYVALVHNGPSDDSFEVDAKLAPHPTKPGVMRVDSKRGKRSLTRVTTAERYLGYALLNCNLDSGRTHQIRVHLKHVRCPLVGDTLYGGKPLWLSRLKRGFKQKKDQPEKPLISRVALHAESLQISHPVTGEPVDIRSPWPKDLTVAVKYLRKFAAAGEALTRAVKGEK